MGSKTATRPWALPAIAIAVTYVLFVLATMFHAAGGVSALSSNPSAMIGMALWACSPIVVLALVLRAIAPGLRNGIAWLIGLLAAEGLGLVAYTTTFWIGPGDAQGAIAFVVVPVYQWGIVAASAVAAWFVRHRS